MDTYCINSDLVLDSGENITTFLDSTLNAAEQIVVLNNNRERTYRNINESWLLDKTVTVETGGTLATILGNIPALKHIEIDQIIGNVLAGAFSAGTIKTPTQSKFYAARATTALKRLQFPATATTPILGSASVGNGTISAIEVNDETTKTENWILTATDDAFFIVQGLKTAHLPSCEVGEDYPNLERIGSDYGFESEEISRYGFYPVRFTITAGSIAFARYDKFTFRTFASSKPKHKQNRILLA